MFGTCRPPGGRLQQYLLQHARYMFRPETVSSIGQIGLGTEMWADLPSEAIQMCNRF